MPVVHCVYLGGTAGQPPGCASLAAQLADALMAGVAIAEIVRIVGEIGKGVVVVGLRRCATSWARSKRSCNFQSHLPN